MLNKAKSVCFISILLLSACSILKPETADSVALLVKEQNFDEAIAIYNQLKEQQQNLVDIEQLQKSRTEYESKLINLIRKLGKKNEFTTAKAKYEEGIKNIPSSDALLNSGKDLEVQKQSYIAKHQYSYNLARATFLINEKTVLEKLYPAKSDEPEFLTLYNNRLKERELLAETLGTLGLEKLSIKHPKTATKLLKLAQSLKPDSRWKTALSSLGKRQKALARKQKEKLAKEKQLEETRLQQKLTTLKGQFESAMSSGDLPAAQQAVINYKKLNTSNNSWLISAKNRLEKTIQTSLEIALKKGQILYSQGEISQALKVWRKAQRYAPNNTKLNDSIKRAATFEKNLLNLTAPQE